MLFTAENKPEIVDFIRNSSVLFYQCDVGSNFPITYVSTNARQLLGYNRPDLMKTGTSWVEKIHPDDRERIDSHFTNLKAPKRKLTYRFKHANGSYIWLRDESTVQYDENGKPEAIRGIATDITDQKKAEQRIRRLNNSLEQRIRERTKSLQRSNRKLKKQIRYRNKAEEQMSVQQQRLKLLEMGINAVDDMVIITRAPVDDPLNSEVILVNHNFERFTGYSLAEIEGQNPDFLHGEQTQPEILARLHEAIKAHEPTRVEMISYKKDGTPYWVELEISPFPAEEAGIQYWVGINRNITKRKKQEQALERSKQKYKAYAELSFDAIYEISIDGHIVDCNRRACTTTGYTRDELIGMHVSQLTPEDYRFYLPDIIERHHTTGSKALQRQYVAKDGSIMTCEVSTRLYSNEKEDHLIAYVRDISEHIKNKQKIEASLKEKNMLLAEVHHRVKNNLAVISGLIELQTFNATDTEVIESLQESKARIQSIASVHEKLYKSESFTDIKMGEYIDDLMNYLANSFGNTNTDITLQGDISSVSLTVKQAVPCGLILNELITNIYKHAFAERQKGTIRVNLNTNGSEVELSVCDDGVGLPPDFSVKGSSSLGMKLIRTLVAQLSGNLTIKKDPLTCFIITFKAE